MKHIILTILLLVSTSLFAQIGPNPLSNLSSWRVEEVYSLGQTVIRGGVIYQSLENNNVAFDPAGSPGQWTTIIGSSSGSNLPSANGAGAIPVSTGPGTTYSALPANANSGQGVLVSTAATIATPTTKTCEHQAAFPGTGNSVSCTWSSAPQAGEFIAVSVNLFGTGTTFTVTDSASNSYTAYGSVHHNSTAGIDVQTFYFGPLVAPITTLTVSVASGNYLTIMADTVTSIAASSPTDGQVVADGTSAPFSTPTLTTTTNGDYVFCAAIGDANSGLAAGSGFTQGARLPPPIYTSLNQYQIQSVAGAITPSIGGTVVTSATLQCSAFKSAGSSAATTGWNQSVNLANVQAQNTEVIPNPATPSGGDDYANLQNAINTAISEDRILYVPCGLWQVSAGLVASATNFRMHGCGNGNPSDGQITQVSATGYGYNTMTIGTGTPWSLPQGWLKDVTLAGPPNWYTNIGYSALQLNGTVMYLVENVYATSDDMAVDLINNCYGTNFVNLRVLQSYNNIGVNLRNGSQSGSDISFFNPWVTGYSIGVNIAGQGGGYHFYGGQIGGGISSGGAVDTSAAISFSKEYPSGTIGETSADFFGTSFEGTQNAWVWRGWGAGRMACYDCSMNATNASAPGIGVYKNTNVLNGQVIFDGTALSGYYSNAQLVVASGINEPGSFMTERGTYSAGQNPYINGSYQYVTSMMYQSGLQANSVGSDRTGLETSGLWLINNSGQLQTSTNQGSSALFVPNMPSGSAAYDFLYTNPTANSLARIAGNSTTTPEVLVSQGSGAASSPTTKTCAAGGGSAVSPITCTWSTAPVSGETVACYVFNYASAGTFAVTDSASNSYTGIGNKFTSTQIPGSSQIFYKLLSGSITTTSFSSTTPNFLTMMCNTSNNIQASSPPDGSCTSDSNSSTTCSTPIVTTKNDDYVFCGGITTGTLTHGSGFTLGSTANSGAINQYQVQSTAGSITPAMSSTAATQMNCSAFKSTLGPAAPILTNSPQLSLPLYTVSSGTGNPALPAASSVPTGTQVGVTDALSFTAGTCTGGGSDFQIAISNGTTWSCH